MPRGSMNNDGGGGETKLIASPYLRNSATDAEHDRESRPTLAIKRACTRPFINRSQDSVRAVPATHAGSS